MRKMFLLPVFLVPVVFSAAQDRMVPHWWRTDHLKVQYAGGTGFLSLGAGYQYKKQSLEGDLFYGYVPKSVGGVTIHMVTAKVTGQVLRPLNLRGYELRPLALRVSLTHTFGAQYFLFDPDHYPYAYYVFPTALHGGLFAGDDSAGMLAAPGLACIMKWGPPTASLSAGQQTPGP